MKYKWLLFDADGTLFDFDTAAAAALEYACRRILGSYEPGYATLYEGINQRIWREFEAGRIDQNQLRTRRFELLFEGLGVQADAVAFSDTYLGNLATHSDLLPGAAEAVSRLAEVAELMIITNGLREVQRPRFARAPICRHFADFVISEEVGAAKPDPRIFEAAFALMGHPARAEVLMIGDSLTSDIQGGNNYGIDTCWFNPQGKPSAPPATFDYEIKHLAALLEIVAAGTA